MSAGREPWREWRARLDALGFRPSRRLGQNFLLDENLARAIVRDAAVAEGERVLEVGPGLGFLTRPLLEAGARVLAVEIDGRLAQVLREDLGEHPGFELVHGDALEGKHRLAPAVLERLPAGEPWSLVSNLPYSVSAPLLAVLAGLPAPPASMTALVQREVAERLAARPGTPDWGPISARLQAAYRVEPGRAVGPAQFWPRPKVDSAVVHLRRLPEPPAREDLERLSELVGALFQRRRQKLGRVLGDLLGGREPALAALEALGVDPGVRAETLDLEALRGLADRPEWRERAGAGRRAGKIHPGELAPGDSID